MTLTVVADENIVSLDDYFAPYARIVRKPGRSLCAADLVGADALLVRSVSTVDSNLLIGSNVQFVGSATIGTDHVDREFLGRAGIAFANAPGSNAASVADYVCSALAVLVPDLLSVTGAGLRAGVIGLGEVGSRMASRLQTLGYEVIAHDPFKSAVAGIRLTPLEEVLDSDVVTLHVPLTRNGPHPTRRMIDSPQLRHLPSQSILINTSRGGVVHGKALAEWLDDSPGAHAVLDVWENEPSVDPGLARRISLATPHIAGYATDAKLRGTTMLADAFVAHFNLAQDNASGASALHQLSLTGDESLNDVLLKAFDVRNDDSQFRQVLANHDVAAGFDALRKHYPARREYAAMQLSFEQSPDAELLHTLKELGFNVAGNER